VENKAGENTLRIQQLSLLSADGFLKNDLTALLIMHQLRGSMKPNTRAQRGFAGQVIMQTRNLHIDLQSGQTPICLIIYFVTWNAEEMDN
jgi:hypothetical protein